MEVIYAKNFGNKETTLMIKKAVIPAAGLGIRFLPATKAQPKEMLPVVDKPVIQYVVEEAIASGIDDILIITGRGKRAIEDHFDVSLEVEENLRKKGDKGLLEQIKELSNLADIHYIRQKEQKGLGDAIYHARKHISEPFAVLLGDTITISNIKPCTRQLIDVFERYSKTTVAVEQVPQEKISSYGVIKGDLIDDVYLIKDLIEKPKPEDAPSDLGIIGRYILTPEIFDFIEETPPGFGGEIQLTDALKAQCKTDVMYAYITKCKRYDIGDKMGWMKATLELALARDEFRDELTDFMRRWF